MEIIYKQFYIWNEKIYLSVKETDDQNIRKKYKDDSFTLLKEVGKKGHELFKVVKTVKTDEKLYIFPKNVNDFSKHPMVTCLQDGYEINYDVGFNFSENASCVESNETRKEECS